VLSVLLLGRNKPRHNPGWSQPLREATSFDIPNRRRSGPRTRSLGRRCRPHRTALSDAARGTNLALANPSSSDLRKAIRRPVAQAPASARDRRRARMLCRHRPARPWSGPSGPPSQVGFRPGPKAGQPAANQSRLRVGDRHVLKRRTQPANHGRPPVLVAHPRAARFASYDLPSTARVNSIRLAMLTFPS